MVYPQFITLSYLKCLMVRTTWKMLQSISSIYCWIIEITLSHSLGNRSLYTGKSLKQFRMPKNGIKNLQKMYHQTLKNLPNSKFFLSAFLARDSYTFLAHTNTIFNLSIFFNFLNFFALLPSFTERSWPLKLVTLNNNSPYFIITDW